MDALKQTDTSSHAKEQKKALQELIQSLALSPKKISCSCSYEACPLQNIYVEEWASYLALDSGVRDKDNNIEVLFVHDSQTNKLLHCDPSDLNKDLNGVGYTNQLGEFTFTSVSSEGLVPRANLS